MSVIGEVGAGASQVASAARVGVVRAVFAVTLFLSALLLFSMQPMFAKMVLPILGGSPAVWAVSTCFFQIMLLAGYLYAHLLNRWLAPRWAALLHLSLLAVTAVTLPFGIAPGLEPPPGDAYLWLSGVLFAGVGLPFFAVSANAPLLQAWFAQSATGRDQNPYVLYGASNLGSLIALLSYPLLVEPAIGLSAQAVVWSFGFSALWAAVAFAAALAGNFRGSDPRPRTEAVAADAAQAAPASTPITWHDRAIWLALSFVPSGLLVAATSFISSDVASAPLLWVVPLALYLLTFVLAFTDHPIAGTRFITMLQPVAVGAVVVKLIPTDLTLVMVLGALFATAFVCHRALFDRRPAPARLTEFYFWMSLGGALGGMFSALVAPQIFNTIYEFPLLLLAGMACRPGALATPEDGSLRLKWAFIVLLLATVAADGRIPGVALPPIVGPVAVLGLACWIGYQNAAWQFRVVAVSVLMLLLLPSGFNSGERTRSFFGIHRVQTVEDGRVRLLSHGITTHGVERIIDADGTPIVNPIPGGYYYTGSPAARALSVARLGHDPAAGLRVGIVGLGAGAMACHSQPQDTWRYFEIDPAVVKIARDPNYFSFLSKCLPGNDIVLGDARLTLAKEGAGSFDYLLIDAFSSDAVPVHLLTRESIALYLSRLGPDGVLALHLSSRHLDLVSVAIASAAGVPDLKTFVVRAPGKPGYDEMSSTVVVMTRSLAAAEAVAGWPDAGPAPPASVRPWTDDYSDILGAVWRRMVDGAY